MIKAPVFLLLVAGLLPAQEQNPEGDVLCSTPDACWKVLVEGNRRWAANPIALKHPNQTSARRNDLANPERKQRPFAVILTCSDSRVPPELIFDRGLGDLFVVRLAGNVIGKDVSHDFALASIQYAVNELKARLVVVLGHQRCGAAEAALSHRTRRPPPPPPLSPPLKALVKAIFPAVDWGRSKWGPKIEVDDVADANVYTIIRKVEAIVGSDAVKGKRYNLDGNVVDLREALVK